MWTHEVNATSYAVFAETWLRQLAMRRLELQRLPGYNDVSNPYVETQDGNAC